jgi:ubiquitin carboxyl-terminal hydrolase 25/28
MIMLLPCTRSRYVGKQSWEASYHKMFAHILQVQDDPACIITARKAISLIADYRNSERLRAFLRGEDMIAPEMDLGEAYAVWQIDDRTVQIDLDVMRSVKDMGECSEKQVKAFPLIEQDQMQRFHNKSDLSEARRNDYPLESWPVGLRNIGNTCYLNSVLQFLFTIQPLRELVLHCEDHLQDPSPEALLSKRVGRVAVTAVSVEIAQKFILELRTFFQQLINAPTDTVRPTIDLAVLALCKTLSPTSNPETSDTKSGQTKDLGSIDGIAVHGPKLPPANNADLTAVDSADSVMGDDQSDTSMQAMDLQDEPISSNTTAPAPPTRPPPIPPRPVAQENTKISSMEFTARQQDASETLSNIFDLLRCAIRGNGVLDDNEQFDQIKKIFFSEVVSVRNTKSVPVTFSESRDHFLVTPGFRDRSISATLDNEFDEVELDGGETKYEYIAKPAPVQIINLRRLQFDPIAKEQVYDRSHIRLETPLYLDQYLQKTQTLSELQLLKLRGLKWQRQARLRLLAKRAELLKKTDIEDMDLADTVQNTASFIHGLAVESRQESGSLLPTPPPELADDLTEKATSLKQELADIDVEMKQIESEIDSIFKDCNDVPYRLHAVFMHRGSQTGGHYWIYIYDFQNSMWRKYNDDTVDVADLDEVLKLEAGKAPAASTGIVYVREDMVDSLTQAVMREPTATNANGDVQFDAGAAPAASTGIGCMPQDTVDSLTQDVKMESTAMPNEEPNTNGNVMTKTRKETAEDIEMRDANDDDDSDGTLQLEVIEGVEQA